LRSFFEVDSVNIVVAAIAALADDGGICRAQVAECLKKYDYVPSDAVSWSDPRNGRSSEMSDPIVSDPKDERAEV